MFPMPYFCKKPGMNVFLATPPFTQLNTPYPATAYLKGFLNLKGISTAQADLGLEVILEMFSADGLRRLFSVKPDAGQSQNAMRIFSLREDYIQTIDPVIAFLQGKNPTLALQICRGDFLPQAARFDSTTDLEHAFGTMGDTDRAKHLATLFLEDIADFIVEAVDPHFGFSRYAERLGRSANSFDALHAALQSPASFTDNILFEVLAGHFSKAEYDLVLISVPFPGNLYSAFRMAKWLREHHPQAKIAMGGGFPNTELRSLSDARVFEYFDFITLDDGETPVENLIEHISGTRPIQSLKRTFALIGGQVVYCNGSQQADYRMADVGTPDYEGLVLDRYLSVIEVANPMHRLWSDGRWNKLTMAHGCYWGKCTFCDISLDYIKIYEPVAAWTLCDRMEELIAKTGQNGFHFVDEAAPPALMRELALEILRRGLQVTWWTNIRFEKSFTPDLCRLLRASGCIAVSGGLEVASDRLLALIDKGVTVAQVARVTDAFTRSGIMVHAYLMYGYPTQTVQETVDSLEMVRQLFQAGTLQSGFWHQFAMTAHAPVGLHPERFGVEPVAVLESGFAINDLEFIDRTGIDHARFSFGLRKSLYNYMHGIGLDYQLQEWFDFRIPKSTIPRDFIQSVLQADTDLIIRTNAKIAYIGTLPESHFFIRSKKGREFETGSITVHTRTQSVVVEMPAEQARFTVDLLARLSNGTMMTLGAIAKEYESELENFELFWFSKPMAKLREAGLLVL